MISIIFSTSDFWWIYGFWDALNKIWLFLGSFCLPVSLCMCDKNFLASIFRELMHRISWNFTFSVILTQTDVCQLLVKTDGVVVTFFPENMRCADLSFYWMKLHKNLYTKYISSDITIMQFEYIYLVGCSAVALFPKFFWWFYLGFYYIISYKILQGICWL